MQKLRETENKTSQHLGPSVAPINAVRDPKKLVVSLKSLMAVAHGRVVDLFRKKPAPPERPKDPVALASLRGMNAGYGSRFKRKHKLMLISAVVFVVLLAAGIALWDHRNKIAAEAAAWQSTHDQIADLKNRVDSDLIYGNEGKAAAEVREAEGLLAALATDTPDRKTKAAALDAGLKEARNKLKKIVQMNNTTELGVLAPDAPPGSLTAIVLAGDMLYAADNDQKAVLKINLLNRETKRIPMPKGLERITHGMMVKESILFVSEDNGLYAVNRQTDLMKSVPWTHAKSSSTRDIVVYAAKLYALDPANGQVWKTSASSGGYGGETGYVKAANTTLNDAVSLAIDSNVYVLKADGAVVQFAQGGQTGFSLLPVDPPVVAPSDIWTELDSTLIAIADTASKRVLLYDKSGALRAQIQSNQFQGPTEVAADEVNKRLVVIDGNRVLLFQLP